jgi:hypothetical protein
MALPLAGLQAIDFVHQVAPVWLMTRRFGKRASKAALMAVRSRVSTSASKFCRRSASAATSCKVSLKTVTWCAASLEKQAKLSTQF